MLSMESIDKYYKDVPEDELEKFQNFLKNHTKKNINFQGQNIAYYCCGRGEKTIFLPPGVAGGIFPPEYGFRSIKSFEDEYRVIAPDMIAFSSVDEQNEILNQILDAEGIDKVSILAGSGQGIIAQIYFKNNCDRVEKLILYNTPALKGGRNKKWVLWIIKMLPSSVFRAVVKKKLKSLIPADVPLEAAARLKLMGAFLHEVITEKFNRKNLLSFLKLIFEFNKSGGYTPEDFKGWKGQTLIMTSEDDRGYKDVPYLMDNLPNTSLFKFQTGYKHLAPTVFMEEFIKTVKDFLNKETETITNEFKT